MLKDVAIYEEIFENHKTGAGLLDEFKMQLINMYYIFTDKAHLILSFILSLFLTSIGWQNHNEVLSFLIVLPVLDVITKHISIIIKQYGQFTIPLYFRGWGEKFLTSRKFKVGFFVKLVCYSIGFYIANQVQVVPEFSGKIGDAIAWLVYVNIFIAEVSSLGENFRDMGLKGLANLTNGIKDIIKKSE